MVKPCRLEFVAQPFEFRTAENAIGRDIVDSGVEQLRLIERTQEQFVFFGVRGEHEYRGASVRDRGWQETRKGGVDLLQPDRRTPGEFFRAGADEDEVTGIVFPRAALLSGPLGRDQFERLHSLPLTLAAGVEFRQFLLELCAVVFRELLDFGNLALAKETGERDRRSPRQPIHGLELHAIGKFVEKQSLELRSVLEREFVEGPVRKPGWWSGWLCRSTRDNHGDAARKENGDQSTPHNALPQASCGFLHSAV